ncbi:hypothetical protein K1T71_008434 [Dendrolimus kikuchii]|uniref:Uncharacterized protein n=1 Tax=Dendrolimus kikuchii TaxID=765133 RepID=A0ACC1CXH3_9NEOP|nr:hypothetical protein K1T71_008434 [Dendrolimus kikuchii]
MDWTLDYGDLAKDTDFVNNCENLVKNLKEVQEVLDELLPLKKHYDKMSLPAQIELDLFLAYTLNSLHWISLRIEGVDPTKHPIKNELQRIKMTMLRWQQVKDRDKRPTMDLEAAKRFVKSGLYDPYKSTAEPQNKKRKFEDNDE